MSLDWNLGLRNFQSGKYLTVENFGFKVNANASALKKKQRFTLVSEGEGKVHIRNHLGRFIYGDRDGKIHGDAEGTSPDTAWEIDPQADGTWALKTSHGYYFHGEGDDLSAFIKEVTPDGKWAVQLAMHPQINLYNAMRKRFAHLNDKGDAIHNDEDIPWGEDALIELVFFGELREGRYGIRASNGKYLNSSGKLTSDAGADAQFLLGFHDDHISLRNSEGMYLSPNGRDGVLRAVKERVTKDELFKLEDSQPQFTIVDSRGKYVSNRSSTEVKADQANVTDLERFQLETQPNGKAQFKNQKSKYWTTLQDGTVVADQDAGHDYQIEWHGAQIKIVSNGKYITVKPNGSLIANGDGSEDTALFTMSIINRPTILLRGQYGYVGLKGGSGRVEVNKSKGVSFELESKNGDYFLKTDGKYWTVDGDGVAATASSPVTFHLEFVKKSEFLIKHADSGNYLQGEQNGGFKATGKDANLNTLWEF